MMVVDASALVAILLAEPEEQRFTDALSDSPRNAVSAINFWELLVRAEGLRGQRGREEAETLIRLFEIEVVSIDATQARSAADAYAKYGRRTPAGLNLGDCFAYALAKTHGDGALLYKGDDFPRTDILSALPAA